MGKLFSFDGRIRRQGFWLVNLALGVVSAILYFIASSMSSGSDPNTFVVVILLIPILAIAVAQLSLSVRRWHDLNKSGWWVLIGLVPIVGGIYSLIMLGFMAGDQGDNSFGPAPEEGVLL